MKRKLQLHTSNKLKVRNQIKFVVTGAVLFAFLVGVWLIYLNFGSSKRGYSNQESFLSNFSWKRSIELSHAYTTGQEFIEDFPLLIRIKDPEFRSIKNGGKVIHSKGYDIRFTKSNGKTFLPSQIDSYDPQTGEIAVWVMLDTLSLNSNKELTIYYSNATIKSELPDNLWTGIFQGIWHMTNLHASNNRKYVATAFGTNETAGVIGKARLFDSSRNDAAFFAYSNQLDLTKEFGFSAWIKLNELGREQVILSNEDGISGGYKFYLTKDNKLNLEFINVSGKRFSLLNSSGGLLIEKNKWYYVSGSYSLIENKLITYVNGKADRSLQLIESPNNSNSDLQIGRDLNNNEVYFNGIIDEVRISSYAINQNKLIAEYKNQLPNETNFKLKSAEIIELNRTSVKENKLGLNEMYSENREEQESTNNLKAKRMYFNNEAPNTLTSSIEALQTRMNYIRNVSEENTK